MSRTLPTECEHGNIIDMGVFGKCEDCSNHPDEPCPDVRECEECELIIAIDAIIDYWQECKYGGTPPYFIVEEMDRYFIVEEMDRAVAKLMEYRK